MRRNDCPHILILLLTFLPVMEANAIDHAPTCMEDYRGAAGYDPAIGNNDGGIVLGQTDDCFYHKAQDSGDIKYCGYVQNLDVSWICVNDLAVKKRDLKLCDSGRLSKKPQDKLKNQINYFVCVNHYAVHFSDSEACNQIKEKLGRSDFQNNCIVDVNTKANSK
jgi:hypothetical protein